MAKPIQLYSVATPNGQKIGIALKELGLAFEPHTINIGKNEQMSAEYLKINPNNKIPAITDPDGPGGKPITLFESGAILMYLADKTGKLMPTDPALKWETVTWIMWQMGGVGPMFGQFGYFFKFAKEKVPHAIERYTNETRRLLGVLEKRLADGRQYIMGDEYTMADICSVTWVNALRNPNGYNAAEHLQLQDFPLTYQWVDRIMARPAVQEGIKVTPFPSQN